MDIVRTDGWRLESCEHGDVILRLDDGQWN
jgi:hypothetical protein